MSVPVIAWRAWCFVLYNCIYIPFLTRSHCLRQVNGCGTKVQRPADQATLLSACFLGEADAAIVMHCV